MLAQPFGAGVADQGPDGTMHRAEHRLADALERVLRGSLAGPGRPGRPGWAMLALHLSAMAAPRPHHRRVAGMVLDEMVERCSGQVFGLGNGDLAMLFQPGEEGAGVSAMVQRLFEGTEGGTEGGGDAGVQSLWFLPASAAAAREYVEARVRAVAGGGPAGAWRDAGDTAGGEAGRVRGTALPELLVRQTAIRLHTGQARRVVPVFREISVVAGDAEQGDGGGGPGRWWRWWTGGCWRG